MLSDILGRPDLDPSTRTNVPDAGTLYATQGTGALTGSGAVPASAPFVTDPSAGVHMVEPGRPSWTDAQDAAQLAPVVGVSRPVQAGGQFSFAAEYTDERGLNGEHGVVVGRPVLVTIGEVHTWDPSPEPVWREPPREDRPDLCGRGGEL